MEFSRTPFQAECMTNTLNTVAFLVRAKAVSLHETLRRVRHSNLSKAKLYMWKFHVHQCFPADGVDEALTSKHLEILISIIREGNLGWFFSVCVCLDYFCDKNVLVVHLVISLLKYKIRS